MDAEVQSPREGTSRNTAANIRTALLAIALILIASGRIASTYKVFNFTIDEPAHIACGAEWLESGAYRLEVQHPPLERVVAALGARYAGNRWDGNSNMWYAGIRLLAGGRGERGLVFGRAAVLPLFWVACSAVFLWARRLGGNRAGLIGLILFTSLPAILAHAGLITTDIALTAFTGSSGLAMLWWAGKPDCARAVVLGILSGLAVLSKFSAIPFLLVFFALTSLSHLIRYRPGFRQITRSCRIRLPSGLLTLVTAALIIWAGYRFSFGMSDAFRIPVPAPEFFSGIAAVMDHNDEGHVSYLLGSRNVGGFWYYYPVALFAKTPLAMAVLLAIATTASLTRRYPVGFPLLFSLAVLSVAFFSNINVGIRHVLPFYIGITVATGVALSALIRDSQSKWVPVAIGVLVSLNAISGMLQHPDYLSYTNELFWTDPERVLADSDVDWGQDMKRLNSRMEQLGVRTLFFNPFNRGYLLANLPLPKLLPVPEGNQQPLGWTAVSISVWKLAGGPKWIANTRPTERIGRSILLFYNPGPDLR